MFFDPSTPVAFLPRQVKVCRQRLSASEGHFKMRFSHGLRPLKTGFPKLLGLASRVGIGCHDDDHPFHWIGADNHFPRTAAKLCFDKECAVDLLEQPIPTNQANSSDPPHPGLSGRFTRALTSHLYFIGSLNGPADCDLPVVTCGVLNLRQWECACQCPQQRLRPLEHS